MMPLSANDLEALHSEIQLVSSTQEIVIKLALHLMLDLLSPSLDVSPGELLRRYLANIQAVELLSKSFVTYLHYSKQSFFLLESILIIVIC